MRTLRSYLGIALLLLATGRPVAGGEPLTIRVMPANAVAPADILVEVFIEPNEQNRSIAIEAESENFYTSSTTTLEGDRAPRTKIIRFRTLPAGSYEVRVRLIGTDGDRAQLTRHVLFV